MTNISEIKSGPSLHEILHHYGNYNLDTPQWRYTFTSEISNGNYLPLNINKEFTSNKSPNIGDILI